MSVCECVCARACTRVFVCRNKSTSFVFTYVTLGACAWTFAMLIKRNSSITCTRADTCVCVCRPWHAREKPSMSDWRQGPGWAVKRQGASTSCAVIIKSTSIVRRLSPGMRPWLKCMISYGSPRWTDRRGQIRWRLHRHRFESVVLIILASVASNRGRPHSPSFWARE